MDSTQLAAMAEELAKRQKTAPSAPAAGAATKPDVLGIKAEGCGILNAANKAKDALLAVLSVPEEGEVEALRSDADEQLLISIQLAQPSKISSIRIAAPEAATAPSTVKLFVNRDHLAFDDVEDLPPTQVLELSGVSAELKLNFVKFQNVSTLTVFIEGNQGESATGHCGEHSARRAQCRSGRAAHAQVTRRQRRCLDSTSSAHPSIRQT